VIRKAPVVIRLYPDQIKRLDLMKEIKIDRHHLSRELIRQPARYMYWSALYSEVAAKCEEISERLDHLESKLSIRYSKVLRERQKRYKVSDVKYYISLDSRVQKLRTRLRRWRRSERVLKYAVRALEQRKDVLQSFSANQRKEWDAEVKTRRSHEEDD
jgi:hypothetical protein